MSASGNIGMYSALKLDAMRMVFRVSRAALIVLLAVSLVLCVCMPSTFAWSSIGQHVLNELFGNSDDPGPGPEVGALAIRNTVVRADGKPLDDQDKDADFLFEVVFYLHDDANDKWVPEQNINRPWRFAEEGEDLGFDSAAEVSNLNLLNLNTADAASLGGNESAASAAADDASTSSDAGVGFANDKATASTVDVSYSTSSADLPTFAAGLRNVGSYGAALRTVSSTDIAEDDGAGSSMQDDANTASSQSASDDAGEGQAADPGSFDTGNPDADKLDTPSISDDSGTDASLAASEAIESSDSVSAEANGVAEDGTEEEPQERVYSIILKHGQIAVFEDLEPGLRYVVREIGVVDPALAEVYRVIYDSHEGDIHANEVAHAEFVNVRGVVGDTGEVALEKTVVRAGSADWALTEAQRDAEFTFRATMTSPEEPDAEQTDDKATDAALSSDLVSHDADASNSSDDGVDDAEGVSADAATDTETYSYKLYKWDEDGELEPIMQFDPDALPTDPDRLIQVERSISGNADDVASCITLKSGQVALFENLPAGTVWSFEEVLDEASGQADVYTPDKLRLSGSAVGGMRTQVTFTNVAVEEMAEISGTKIWEVEFNGANATSVLPIARALASIEDEARSAIPESIEVTLVHADDEGNQIPVQTQTVVPDTEGTWKYTFSIPAYDESGEPTNLAAYTVHEADVTGFEAEYVRGEDGSLDIHNAYVGTKSSDSGQDPDAGDNKVRTLRTLTPLSLAQTGDPLPGVLAALVVLAVASAIVMVASYCYLRRHRH